MPLILNTCIQQTYLLLLWWKETPMLLPMEEHDSQITTWLWTGTSVHLQTGRTGLYQNYHVVVNWRLTLVPISCQVIEQDNIENYHVVASWNGHICPLTNRTIEITMWWSQTLVPISHQVILIEQDNTVYYHMVMRTGVEHCVHLEVTMWLWTGVEHRCPLTDW